MIICDNCRKVNNPSAKEIWINNTFELKNGLFESYQFCSEKCVKEYEENRIIK